MEDSGLITAHWPAGCVSAAATDVVSFIGESDAVGIHQQWAARSANPVIWTELHPDGPHQELAFVLRRRSA